MKRTRMVRGIGGSILVIFKLGFIPFAATNHFYLIGRWWRRRNFRYHLVDFGFGLGRHRRSRPGTANLSGWRRCLPFLCPADCAKKAESVLPAKPAPASARRPEKPARVITGAVCASAEAFRSRLLPTAMTGDVFEDGGGLTVVAALTAGSQHIHARARLHEAGHRNHVVDTHRNRAHSLRDHRGQAGSGVQRRQFAGQNKFALADRQNCAAAQDLRWVRRRRPGGTADCGRVITRTS